MGSEGKTRAISLPGVSMGPVAEETDPRANQVPGGGHPGADILRSGAIITQKFRFVKQMFHKI